MMSYNESSIRSETAYLIVNSQVDNVAVSKIDLSAGTQLSIDGQPLELRHPIARGQRFALREIPAGQGVIQYGSAFGISTGIAAGQLIAPDNLQDIVFDFDAEITLNPPLPPYPLQYAETTFAGYRREDGRVGTRNYYLVVPTSQCASRVAEQIAARADSIHGPWAGDTGLDGIVAIPNTEGCGCAGNGQIERFLRILANFINHPNVGGVLIVDLGCEQTNYPVLAHYLSLTDVQAKPTDWLTIQQQGGVRKTIARGLELIGKQIDRVRARRSACPLSELVIGTECGASDAFSGVSANPVIGNAVDRVISAGGSALLSEVPEMIGTEPLLMQRMRHPLVVDKFKAMIRWYQETAEKLGVNMADNLVPENKAGGLINPCIKSLGAIAKGGRCAIEDVLEYGERLRRPGLNLMQGPGNDMESVTGLTASGANLICFSTGKGTVTGSAIVPVIKLSSTSELYQRLPEDIDFDAGVTLLPGGATIEELGEKLFGQVLAIASGLRSRAEDNEQRQFQVWTAGKLSL